jgi:hypothetical protein
MEEGRPGGEDEVGSGGRGIAMGFSVAVAGKVGEKT